MILDDLERQNKGLNGFFGHFGLRKTFQERISPNSLQIDQDKLHTNFLAFNVDFNGPSLDFL